MLACFAGVVWGMFVGVTPGLTGIMAVVIALPLHLHARVAVEAMKAGKHVLTDSLTSLGVLVAIGLVWITGWTPLDPIIDFETGLVPNLAPFWSRNESGRAGDPDFGCTGNTCPAGTATYSA